MVVFTCAHCGESLQKPRVEKHYYTKCRNKYIDICCVDCLKDFRGDEYVAHTKCVTEEERYSAKGFVPKPSQNKGERKQNAWIEMVQSVLNENKSLSQAERYLLQRVSQQPNTPRKKPKFVNFIRSMDRNANQGVIENVWSLLAPKLQLLKGPAPNQPKKEDEHKPQDIPTEETANGKDTQPDEVAENGDAQLSKKERKEKRKREKYEAEVKEIEASTDVTEEVEEPSETKKSSKKRKAKKAEEIIEKTSEVIEEAEAEPVSKKVKKDNATSFDWQNTIFSVLNSKGKAIPLKKLQKKVLTEYCVVNNVAEVTDRIIKKYEKNLNKIPNVKVVQDKVCIVESEE